MSRLLNLLKILFFTAIGVFLIWWISKDLTDADWKQIKSAFRNFNYLWLIPSLLFGVLSHIIRAVRWKMLIKPIAKEPSTTNAFFAVMIGYIANIVFFRMGEVMRCGSLNRYEGISFSKLFGTVVTERIIDLIVLLALLAITVLFQFDLLGNYFSENVFQPIASKLTLSNILILAFMGLVGLGALFFLLRKGGEDGFIGKVKTFAKSLLDGLLSIKDLQRPGLFILYSLGIWLCYYMMVYVAAFGMEATSGLDVMAGLSILVFGSFGIVATQGGIGAYQLLVQQILIMYAINANEAYAFAWVVWVAQTALIVLLGGLSFMLMPLMNSKNKDGRIAETS